MYHELHIIEKVSFHIGFPDTVAAGAVAADGKSLQASLRFRRQNDRRLRLDHFHLALGEDIFNQQTALIILPSGT